MKSIFWPKLLPLEQRKSIRRFLNFKPGSKAAKFYVSYDGVIFEFDKFRFIRNKKMLSRQQQNFFFFKDHRYMLKQGHIYFEYEPQKEYLFVQVWQENLPYMSYPILILKNFCDKVNKYQTKIQWVRNFNFGLPIGEAEDYPTHLLPNLIRNVVWL